MPEPYFCAVPAFSLFKNLRAEVILGGLLPAKGHGGFVLRPEIFPAAQPTAVVVAHGVTVGTGVVDYQNVAGFKLRQKSLLGEFIGVFADGTDHIPGCAVICALFPGNGDMVIGAVHHGPHQIRRRRIHTGIVPGSALDLRHLRHQNAVGAGDVAPQLRIQRGIIPVRIGGFQYLMHCISKGM